MSSMRRVALMAGVVLLLVAGVVALALSKEQNTAPMPQLASRAHAAPAAEAPAPRQLTPAQQFLAAREVYMELRTSGAPEEKLKGPRAKMVKARQSLRSLGVSSPRGLSDGSGCSKSGGCGGQDESGCSMGAGKAAGGSCAGRGEGSCSVGGGKADGGCSGKSGAPAGTQKGAGLKHPGKLGGQKTRAAGC
jgi:hypothetical protein